MLGFSWGKIILLFFFGKKQRICNRKFFRPNNILGKMAKFTTKIEIKIIDQGTRSQAS